MIKKFALGILMSGVAVITANAQVVASDNFENNNPGTAYNDGIQYGDNGGTGFGSLTYLSGTGGGLFDATGGGNPPIDDARSLGIFADGGGQSLGRTVSTSVGLGIYSVDGRFSVDNTVSFTGFNMKSSLGSAFIDSNELLRFGLNPGNNGQIQITDGTGTHNLSVGTDTELRGPNFNFSVSFSSLAGGYTLTVTDKGNSQTGSFSGTLEDTNGGAAGTGALAAIAFADFNSSGADQNFIVDNLSVTAVPEPSTWLAAGMATAGCVFLRYRRRKA